MPTIYFHLFYHPFPFFSMENIVGERKTIFISAMGRKAKGTGAAASRAGGGRFSAEASNQISLMKWIKITEAAGPGATDILSWAP